MHMRSVAIALALTIPLEASWPTQGPKQAEDRSWPMFGGTPSRNMVNPIERDLPTDWSVEAGKTKNVKWTAKVGGNQLGSPVVAGGKVFFATHNLVGRIPDVEKRKSVMMAFRETDGKLLWHNVHDVGK